MCPLCLTHKPLKQRRCCARKSFANPIPKSEACLLGAKQGSSEDHYSNRSKFKLTTYKCQSSIFASGEEKKKLNQDALDRPAGKHNTTTLHRAPLGDYCGNFSLAGSQSPPGSWYK